MIIQDFPPFHCWSKYNESVKNFETEDIWDWSTYHAHVSDPTWFGGKDNLISFGFVIQTLENTTFLRK